MAAEKLGWTAEQEVALFHAMQGHKPVGLNKHFHMICIQNRLSQALSFTVSAKEIWDHLYSLYDIDALDEVEAIPFPLEEKEFKLPEDYKVVKKASKKEPTQTPEQPFDKDDGGQEVQSSAHSHSARKRGRRSSTGSASPVSSPSRTTKRRR